VLSLSSLIEFLLDMLRDEATKAEFERDPSGTLAARGLSGVTAQDVRDVQPMLADVGGVQRVAHDGGHASARTYDGGGRHDDGGGRHGDGGGRHGGGEHHDAVREIHHVTHEYEVVRPHVTHVTHEHTHNSYAEFSTDNSIHVEEGGTYIDDSFNQDNDGVDNKGGVIDGGTVGGRDVVGSGNETDTTTIEGSYDDSLEVDDSGNTSVEQTRGDADTPSGGNDADDGGHVPIAYDPPYGGSSGGDSFGADTVNDSYAVQGPATSIAEAEPVGAEHA
jgi:hypothetical protein